MIVYAVWQTNCFSGGLLLSCGASLGAFLQWLIQVLNTLSLITNPYFSSWGTYFEVVDELHCASLDFQVVVHRKNGYGFMSSSWKNILKDKDLYKVSFVDLCTHSFPFSLCTNLLLSNWKGSMIWWVWELKLRCINLFSSQLFSLMLPATISSGMAQIASFTDLYFASFIPGAAAALSCKWLKYFYLLDYPFLRK